MGLVRKSQKRKSIYRKAIGKMKLGKAGGHSGVVADILKAAGDEGMRWMTELCNAVKFLVG